MTLIIGGSYQNKLEWAKCRYDEKNIWNGFHVFVKESLEQGKTAEEIKSEVEKRIGGNPELVIISDEIGCGIVPVGKNDRQWRELTGRLLCLIAEKAENVFRITCGIEVRIK